MDNLLYTLAFAFVIGAAINLFRKDNSEAAGMWVGLAAIAVGLAVLL